MQQEHPPNPAQAYENFLVPALFDPWAKVLVERVAPRPGERVLDLACGTGIIARRVAPLVGERGRVVGVDISPDMLAVARSLPAPEGAAIEWRQGNASELDLPAESFDLAVCQQGLQFFPDRTAAARGIHRVLVEGGRAVVAVWQALERHDVLKALFTAESRHLQLPLEQVATPFSLSRDAELRSILGGAGFRDVTIEPVAMDVRFPSADEWVEMTVRAAAAVIPELAQDGEALRALLESVRRESAEAVTRRRVGEALEFPMHAHVAVALK